MNHRITYTPSISIDVEDGRVVGIGIDWNESLQWVARMDANGNVLAAGMDGPDVADAPESDFGRALAVVEPTMDTIAGFIAGPDGRRTDVLRDALTARLMPTDDAA